MKMLKEDFFEHIVRYMDENCMEGEKAEIQYITKNNGIIMPGLVVRSVSRKISPTIYLNSFYEDYMNGKCIEMIEYEILNCYRDNLIENDSLMDFFTDYSKVRERICYKVISKERNQDLLKKIPHVEYLDLAIVFFYSLEATEVKGASVLIKNSHLSMWQTDVETLVRDAVHNTPRIFEATVRSMKDVLINMMEMDSVDNENDINMDELYDSMETVKNSMHVITNKCGVFGASVLLYSDFSKLFPVPEKDYYILPSSIHELIILPAEDIHDVGELKRMVVEVNCTQVPVCDILSDNVYHYSYKENDISIVA